MRTAAELRDLLGQPDRALELYRRHLELVGDELGGYQNSIGLEVGI